MFYLKYSVTMKNTGNSILTLVGGMILGSAITMLLTPKSGPEMRQDIKDLINDEVDKLKYKAGKLRDEFEEIRCKCDE